MPHIELIMEGKQVIWFRSIREMRSLEMPKMKSNSSATKRFKRTGSGKVKRGQSHRRHILTKKSTKRKRHLRSPESIHENDMGLVRRMMPYG